MPSQEIEEFAKALVRHVRDAAVESCDAELRQTSHSPVATRWRKASTADGKGIDPKVLIPDCVDQTIFYLLNAIDQELLQLLHKGSSGTTVDLPVDGHGELGGWFMASGGWRAKYSETRFHDDFADLA